MSQNTKHNNSTQETETVTWQKAQCQTEKYLSIYKRNHGMTRNTVSAHKEHLSMYLHILFLALKRQLHMYIHNQSRSSNSLQVTTTTSRHSSILTLLWVEFYTLLWFWRSTCINVCSCINFSLSLFSPSSLVTHTYVDSLTAYGVMRPSDTQKQCASSLSSLHSPRKRIIVFVKPCLPAIAKCFILTLKSCVPLPRTILPLRVLSPKMAVFSKLKCPSKPSGSILE